MTSSLKCRSASGEMVSLVATFCTMSLAFMFSLSSLCHAADVGLNDASGILLNLNGIMKRLDIMESSMANTVADLRNKLEAHVNEEATKMSLLLESWQREFETRLDQSQTAVMSRISTVTSIVNATQGELTEYERLKRIRANSNTTKCKEGWDFFQNSCYFISTTKVNWATGRKECFALDADYVKVTSKAEFDFLADLIEDHTYIGLSDQETEGTYKWITDGTVHKKSFETWASGNPDNYQDREDCIHYRDSGVWNDAPCSNQYQFACEMKPDKFFEES